MTWPDWWDCEIDLSPHCVKRMIERGFNETDLRSMLEDANSLSEQVHGTFVVTTALEGRSWEVIVAPDSIRQRLVVVTAYPLS